MLNYALIAILLSIFFAGFTPTIVKPKDDDEELNINQSFRIEYLRNFSRYKNECLHEAVANVNYTLNVTQMRDNIERSMYIRRIYNDGCYYGCLGKKLKLLNATNAVVDRDLDIFARIIVNNNHTEDEIEEECADLEEQYVNLTHCEMGFKVYACIIEQITDDD
ncbi:hypothetical protein FQR65_LT18442 [Abscondita terminalis]|nr:hypothetical protein FQR65_LT12564 [Abscondita terminalis]KAF5307225.1 hypothetical protein FQR65_LT18442 [Abscondita terminalis]